jgi:TPR repeat protein
MRWCLFFAVFLLALPARADFAEGLAAYDAGNYGTARAAWSTLAEAGDVRAQTALAGLYAQGAGVPRDYAIATRWFRRAADRGHVIAQLNLGDYYARGLGVPRDLASAWLWLSLAARQGNGWAADRRDAVARRMRPAALEEAKRRLSDWRPKGC